MPARVLDDEAVVPLRWGSKQGAALSVGTKEAVSRFEQAALRLGDPGHAQCFPFTGRRGFLQDEMTTSANAMTPLLQGAPPPPASEIKLRTHKIESNITFISVFLAITDKLVHFKRNTFFLWYNLLLFFWEGASICTFEEVLEWNRIE